MKLAEACVNLKDLVDNLRRAITIQRKNLEESDMINERTRGKVRIRNQDWRQ